MALVLVVYTLGLNIEYNNPTGTLGDVNNDGEISILDASNIQRYLAQYITEF